MIIKDILWFSQPEWKHCNISMGSYMCNLKGQNNSIIVSNFFCIKQNRSTEINEEYELQCYLCK